MFLSLFILSILMTSKLKDIIWWSPTKIKVAQSCLKKYYFEYILRDKIPIPSYFASGIFLHKRMESLYKGNFGNLELAFKSAESFYKQSRAIWIRKIIKEGEIQGKKIAWKNKDEPWELIGLIKQICYQAYQRGLEEGPPLGTEIPIKFEFNGNFFNLRIDEVRKGAVIRDHKTGKWSESDFELGYLTQLTMYALAISCKAHKDEAFSKVFGISNPEELGGNKYIISPEVETQYYHMRSGNISKTRRTDQHYYELKESLDDLESRIRSGLFPVNRQECGRCIHQKVCDQNSSAVIYPKIENAQLNLFPVIKRTKERTKQIPLRFYKARKV